MAHRPMRSQNRVKNWVPPPLDFCFLGQASACHSPSQSSKVQASNKRADFIITMPMRKLRHGTLANLAKIIASGSCRTHAKKQGWYVTTMGLQTITMPARYMGYDIPSSHWVGPGSSTSAANLTLTMILLRPMIRFIFLYSIAQGNRCQSWMVNGSIMIVYRRL